MRTTPLLILALLCLILNACTKEDITTTSHDPSSSLRNTPNMMVTYSVSPTKTVTVQSSKINMEYINASEISLILNPGSYNQQSITTTAIEVSEGNDTSLKITVVGKSDYTNKSNCSTIISGNSLFSQINPGQIDVTGTSIIIEEEDAF